MTVAACLEVSFLSFWKRETLHFKKKKKEKKALVFFEKIEEYLKY